MHISHTMNALLVALALGAGPFPSGLAAEEKEEKIYFAQVPAAAQRTIQAQVTANNAILGDIEKDTENGKVVYEAVLSLPSGKKLEVEVAEDGTLIKVEADDDDDDKDDDKDDKK